MRLLGDGGMGAVFKAADQVLRRFVAVKLLHPNVATNPSSVKRFEREARSAAAIGHPNIIDILDFGRTETSPFLVMEYLRGRSLSYVIATEGPLGVERACRIATHTLAGLAAAHDRGILHRDLKPANLMLVAHLGDRDFVKLCDFGFAALLVPMRRIDDAEKALTPERTLVGTPAYAAPERLRGDDRRDPRIDVYSVGVLLYEMLAGVRPYDAPTFAELARKVRKEDAQPLRSIRGDVPYALERVIHRALAKKPDDRWSGAEELAAALVPWGGRFVPEEDEPSDSFTMDLIKIQVRATQRLRTVDADEAEHILAGRPREAQVIHAPPRAAPPLRELDETQPSVVAPPIHEPDDDDDFEALHGGDDLTVPEQERAWEGALVLSMMRFVARRFGERALRALLDELPEPARTVFRGGVTPGRLVSFACVEELMRAVDAGLGHDDLHLVLECGRAAAEGAFDRMRAIRPPAPPPELLVTELPGQLRELMRGVEVGVKRVGKGYGRLELFEIGPPSLSACVATSGFLDRTLDRFGAADVEVSLSSCRALGDEHCLFDISWL